MHPLALLSLVFMFFVIGRELMKYYDYEISRFLFPRVHDDYEEEIYQLEGELELTKAQHSVDVQLFVNEYENYKEFIEEEL